MVIGDNNHCYDVLFLEGDMDAQQFKAFHVEKWTKEDRPSD